MRREHPPPSSRWESEEQRRGSGRIKRPGGVRKSKKVGYEVKV
jgi:hypothetical protein